MKIVTYVGTYTDARQQGIHILEADTETGAVRPIGMVEGIENPTYLALSRQRPILYAVQGMPAYGPAEHYGAVAAYRIQGDTLKPLNQKPVGVTVPCHLSLNGDETLLAFAEYTNAVSGVFELNADGTLADTPPVTVTHTGSGPDKSRQEKAHAHSATFTPDDTFLCVADLGMDRVVVYDCINRAAGLKPATALAITSAGGSGPRHLVFHPNRRFAFLLHELDNTLTAFRYTGESFVPLQTLSTIPGDCHGFSKASALKLSADGRRLLASNRGHDSIATFAVDPDTGSLDLLRIAKLAGEFPRDFALFPDEAFLLVGHERSNTVSSYAFDTDTGRIEVACGPYAVHRPVCIVFGAPTRPPRDVQPHP